MVGWNGFISLQNRLPCNENRYGKRLWDISKHTSTYVPSYHNQELRHNERHDISNHRHLDCLLNRLLRCASKKKTLLRFTGHCEGNAPVTVGFPSQKASTTENVSIWSRRHAIGIDNGLLHVWWQLPSVLLMVHCSLDPWSGISVQFQSNCSGFTYKWVCNCSLQSSGHFVPASICWCPHPGRFWLPGICYRKY